MLTQDNISSILLYKIIKDYENNGRTHHLCSELDAFVDKVIKYANCKNNEILEISQNNVVKDDVSKLCDFSSAFCILNEDKFRSGGETFAKLKIEQMSSLLLNGAERAWQDLEEMKPSSNVSISVLDMPSGEKSVSVIFWDKGPIIVNDDLSM